MSELFPLRYAAMDLEDKPDSERFLACYRDAWQGAHGSLDGFHAESCLRGAAWRAGTSPEALRAAYLPDGGFAGILALDERRGVAQGLLWLSFLYVSPALRRQGVGRQLLAAAGARARALGRRTLRLCVAPENPAVAFYERCGFAVCGTEPGALTPLLLMEKALPEKKDKNG